MAPSVAQLEAKDIARNLANNGQNGQADTSTGGLDASKITYVYNKDPKPVPALRSPEYAAQSYCTDHMITVAWSEANGWEAPELKPYGPLSLMPTASVFQYATECFEGLKVYRGFDGGLRLFRADQNAKRMQVSTARIALPIPDDSQFLELIKILCGTDCPRWLPKDRAGDFLYLRPTMVATDPSIGVQRPKSALLYIILNLMPPFNEIPGGMRLLASKQDTVRAWPGGFGFAKLGANYGPTLVSQGEAKRRGFHQILWLLPKDDGSLSVTEAGASNFIVVWKTPGGKLQLVTAPVNNGIILDGITRRSVLELCKTVCPELEIVERDFYMHELLEAYDQGRIVESFAAGTAYYICPVAEIQFGDRNLQIPKSQGDIGEYAKRLLTTLDDIIFGNIKHPWGIVVNETGRGA